MRRAPRAYPREERRGLAESMESPWSGLFHNHPVQNDNGQKCDLQLSRRNPRKGRPSGDGLAQFFQQPFQVRHALAQLSNFGANLCDLASQPANLRLHVLAQPTNTREDQPRECAAHAENGNDFSGHVFSKGGIHLLGPHATCWGRTSNSLPRADGTAPDRLVRRSEAGGRTAVRALVNADD